MATQNNITTRVPIYLSLVALFLTSTAFIWLAWNDYRSYKDDINFKNEILKVDKILNEVSLL